MALAALFYRQNNLDFLTKKKMSSSYRARARGAGSRSGGDNVIELSIPMRLVRGSSAAAAAGSDSDDSDDSDPGDGTCYICANSFCSDDECCRSLTHLGCCTQSICCGCLLKSSKRCCCKDDCDAVISLCPFCREVSPVETLDIFLGHKQQPCTSCVKADKRSAAAAAASITAVTAVSAVTAAASAAAADGDAAAAALVPSPPVTTQCT